MFCENCGKKLPEKAAFCVNCGEKVQLPKRKESKTVDFAKDAPAQETNKGVQPEIPVYPENRIQQSVPKQPKKPMSVFSKIILAELVMVVVLGIFFGMKVKEYTSPEYTAKQYFAAVMSGDSKRAYKMVQVENDTFINEEQFQNVIEDMSCAKISNFRVKKEENEKNEDDYTRYIEIAYRLKEDTSDYSMMVTLEKSEEKKWLFFDNWKVNVGDYIVKDISIEAIKGSKITIGGQELSKDLVSQQENEEGNMVYTIPRMFQGNYETVITNDMYENIAFEMNLYKEGEQYFSQTGGTLKKETVEKVMETAKTDFKTLWENAGEKNNFSSVKLQSVITENSDVQSEYENIIGEIADKNTSGIKNLKFGEFEVTAQQKEDYDSYVPYIVVQFVSNVNYTSVTSNWWTGDLEENEESMDGYTASLSYVYQDDGWKLYDMDMDL
ncbi:MAG: zinc-ribbon domain-containing protein [Lachnospiraceae bacterium]|nr:zinc-ribbon domain-containing protein [Lachnospiraceae bacterium]